MSNDLKDLIGKKFRTVSTKGGKRTYEVEVVYINNGHPNYPVVAMVAANKKYKEVHEYTKDLKFGTVGTHPMDLVEIDS